MATSPSDEFHAWTSAWLDAVADGSLTMSQRKLASVNARGGGVDAVKRVAEAKGVHLVVLVDDHGEELVAASRHPIRVIC